LIGAHAFDAFGDSPMSKITLVHANHQIWEPFIFLLALLCYSSNIASGCRNRLFNIRTSQKLRWSPLHSSSTSYTRFAFPIHCHACLVFLMYVASCGCIISCRGHTGYLLRQTIFSYGNLCLLNFINKPFQRNNPRLNLRTISYSSYQM
jgi:hypothetical protein